MREILFRGKRKDNGEWAYGDLSQHKTGKKFIKCGSATSSFEVIPETVGQYTGLTDKNGKKIFEGDIVVTNKFDTPEIKYTITYDEKIATYIGVWKKGCVKRFTTFSNDSDAFEVIGNIHDDKLEDFENGC